MRLPEGLNDYLMYFIRKPKEVIPGEMYRSGQLSKDGLNSFCREYGIKTVFNLRGEHPGKEWFEGEKEACDSLGIKLYNIKLSVKYSPENEEHRKKISEYIKLSEECEKPLLTHCDGGADRTGLACALYLLKSGAELKEAKKQMSIRHGHMRFMHRNLQGFLEALRDGRLEGSEILGLPEGMEMKDVI